MNKTLRFWIGAVLSLTFGCLAISILIHEIRFGLEAVSTIGKVEKYTARKILGRGGGTVVYEVNGQLVRSTFQSWYIYRGLAAGDRLAILYRPSEPGIVAMDSVIQRYGPIAFPLVLAFAAAHWVGIIRRRRQAPIPDPEN